ncbi:MAG: hypothetical protein ACOCWO_03150, partial [Candidatus Muiribacteriaceae bacterium]
MKTRSSSITEKLLFYGVGFLFIFLMLGISAFIWNHFSRKLDELKSQEIEMDKEKTTLDAEIADFKASIKQLEVEIERKEAEKVEDEAQYVQIEEKLEEAKEYLPGADVKPEIMKKVMEEAVSENLNIVYFDQKKLDFINVDLNSITFEMEVSGDYMRLKRFLAFLERPLIVKDNTRKDRDWNIILKIPYPEGVRFYRYMVERRTGSKDGGFDIDWEMIPPETFIT